MDDPRVFEELFCASWGVVREAAYEVLGSMSDAEDAAQEVFARLWVTGTWRRIQHPDSFFRKAGRNQAANMLRRLARRPPTVSLNQPLANVLRSPGPLPDEALSNAELRGYAVRFIDRLPAQCQLICRLVYLRGCSHREAAERLGIKLEAVEKQVARGRRRLRQMADVWASTFVDGGG